MLSFLQYIIESVAGTPPQIGTGASWYNSKTGQITPIEGHSQYDDKTGKELPGANGLRDATYHAGFVVKNLDHFGITPEELHQAILQFENPQNPLMRTPEEQLHLAKKRVDQLATGYNDTNRGVDSLVMSKGWVRVQRHPLSLWAQGKAPALLRLAKRVHTSHPDIRSMHMDVHGARETYGHLDPSIHGMAHVLEGREDIQDFVERGGAPHRSYTRIIRVSSSPSD